LLRSCQGRRAAIAVKLLLDTDIGSDIDDAMCLAYLLAHPDCDLLGITTVTGEVHRRAALASAICRHMRKEVPIVPGCEVPLLLPQRQPTAPQAAILSRWPHDTQFSRGMAVEFLRRTIQEHPGEIILLSIGPLTNIALLFTVDPEISSLLRGLVSMCGVYTDCIPRAGKLEWNAQLDPSATAIVYQTPLRFHRSIGLDVTIPVTISAETFMSRFNIPHLHPILDMGAVWLDRHDKVTFHDPVAAATIFDQRVCRLERGTVEVEWQDEQLQGQTRWAPDPRGRHEVALEVDRERFLRHYFSVVGNGTRRSDCV
jgi:inosine-uridine nucleoside N-ribohydrolase